MGGVTFADDTARRAGAAAAARHRTRWQ